MARVLIHAYENCLVWGRMDVAHAEPLATISDRVVGTPLDKGAGLIFYIFAARLMCRPRSGLPRPPPTSAYPTKEFTKLVRSGMPRSATRASSGGRSTAIEAAKNPQPCLEFQTFVVAR